MQNNKLAISSSMVCSAFEATFVALILVSSAIASGGKMTDWSGAIAVLLTFMHGQLSFDFQDVQEKAPEPTVQNYRWSGRFFIAKEVLWTVTFAMMHAYPLILATIIFGSYPYWRKIVRRQFDMRLALKPIESSST